MQLQLDLPVVPGRETLNALIALNSWVRSKVAGRFGSFSLRQTIYSYKGEALRAYMAAHVDLSPVPVVIKAVCRDCGGEGQNWYQFRSSYDHCCKCHNTGAVHLEFVRVTLPNGHIWHSPREYGKCPASLLQAVVNVETVPGDSDWDVGQTGTPLDFQSLARDLNTVEDWLGGPPRQYVIRWDPRDLWCYRLPLGVRASTCAFCDGALGPEPLVYRASDRLLEWEDWCCASCAKQFAPRFPPFCVPLELITEEASLWLQRREKWTDYQCPEPPGVFPGKEGYLEDEVIPF